MCTTQEERRKYRRYEVRFPATLIHGTGDRLCSMHTHDISANGALLHTNRRFPEGSLVTVEITLENKTIAQLTGHLSCIKVIGKIVRSDSGGLAVWFAQHQILPLHSPQHN